jgi:uncharacterized protein YegP (UPF0339 family)
MSSTQVHEGHPFSAIYNKVRGKAGGMTIGKCDTEFKDNSFDAKATFSNIKIINAEEGVYIIQYDDGTGCKSLPHIYGLAETMSRKTGNDTCGLFNHGHTAAIAFHNPEYVYSESKCEGCLKSLWFDTGKFVAEIDSNGDDMRAVNVPRYMKSNEERLRSHESILKQCISKIHSPVMKSHLESILNGESESYMLHIIKLPKGAESPDNYYKTFLANERMYYYETLKANKEITLETSDGIEHKANAENAIDPLWNRSKFKVLESRLVVKCSSKTDKLIGKLTIKNMDEDDSKELYIYHDTADSRRRYPDIMEARSDEWKEDEPELLTLLGYTNVLNEEEANKQLLELRNNIGRLKKNKLTKTESPETELVGSDFNKIDDIRGVMFHFIHRILGKPYWRDGEQEKFGWGHQRNGGHPRCYIKAIGDKGNISRLLGLQSNKHNTDFEKCDGIIHRYLYCVFGLVVHKYTSSSSNNANTTTGITTKWNLEEFKNHILFKKDKVRNRRAPKNNIVARPSPVSDLPLIAQASSIPQNSFETTSSPTIQELMLTEQERIKIYYDEMHLYASVNNEEIIRIKCSNPETKHPHSIEMIYKWIKELKEL